MMTKTPTTERSKGHLGFQTITGRRMEFFAGPDGDVYTADVRELIMPNNGYRAGSRFHTTKAAWNYYINYWPLDAEDQ
jgi:hypothetical protein